MTRRIKSILVLKIINNKTIPFSSAMSNEDMLSSFVYLKKLLMPGEVLLVEVLVKYIDLAPPKARAYLDSRCRSVVKFSSFLCQWPKYFFVENDKVAIPTTNLHKGRYIAADYFVKVLKKYDKPVDFMELKREHLGKNSFSLFVYLYITLL